MRTETRLLLTFVAGYCDTATFVHMKGIFSAHVTGNFVVFAAALARGVRPEDYVKLLTFPVFLLAVVVASAIYVVSEGGRPKSGLRRILAAMTVLLIAATAGAVFKTEATDIAVTMLVVFALGMQNTLHHFIPGSMTTVMTGTVMNTVARLTRQAMRTPVEPLAPAAVSTLWLISLFAAGCLIAAFGAVILGFSSLGLAALITLILTVREWTPAEKAPSHA